jgi:hypothetical protein
VRPLAAIEDDDPITLAEASEVVLKGAISEATLRAEIRRGNLIVERIGKNLFTTPAYIKRMREKCRVQSSRPDSTSARTKAANESGSSGTGTGIDELAVLKATAKALKKGLLHTSRKSTRRDQGEAAKVMPFPSQRS